MRERSTAERDADCVGACAYGDCGRSATAPDACGGCCGCLGGCQVAYEATLPSTLPPAEFICYPCSRGDHDEHTLAWVPDIPCECPICVIPPERGEV